MSAEQAAKFSIRGDQGSHNSGDITSWPFRRPAIEGAGPPWGTRHCQDPSVKCQPCLKNRKICDQAIPKQPEGTTQGFQDPQENQRPPTSYEDSGLRCFSCYLGRLVCDQGRPRCGNCQRRNHPCDYPIDLSNLPEDIRQGFQDARDNQRPPNTDEYVENRCRNCYLERALCDQDRPKCGNCQERNQACDYPIETSNLPEEMTQGFQGAVDHKSFRLDCKRDDNSFCSSGIEGKHAHFNNKVLPIRGNASVAPPQKSHVTEDLLAGHACKEIGMCANEQKHVDGIIECHAETKAGAKDWHDDCLVCIWYARHVVGSSKGPCDRKRPCNNCLALSEAGYCRYQRTG